MVEHSAELLGSVNEVEVQAGGEQGQRQEEVVDQGVEVWRQLQLHTASKPLVQVGVCEAVESRPAGGRTEGTTALDGSPCP